MNMNMGKMPHISMINLADLQNAVPNKQKLKKKKPKDEQPKPELDIHSIPAPHKIKARLDEYVVGQELRLQAGPSFLSHDFSFAAFLCGWILKILHNGLPERSRCAIMILLERTIRKT